MRAVRGAVAGAWWCSGVLFGWLDVVCGELCGKLLVSRSGDLFEGVLWHRRRWRVEWGHGLSLSLIACRSYGFVRAVFLPFSSMVGATELRGLFGVCCGVAGPVDCLSMTMPPW